MEHNANVDSATSLPEAVKVDEAEAVGLEEPILNSVQTSSLVFSMNKLVSSNSTGNPDEIIARLESFTKKYEQMAVDIKAASQIIEKSSQFAEEQIRAATYLHSRRNLQAIQQSMTNIDTRIVVIQERLNKVRKQLPPKKHSLVEQGPFYYKCVYPGGVRYRDYPSSSAKVVGEDAVVVMNQVVAIAERVFIASEHSVYLHNQGVGWLFENKKDIICFVRVPAPSFT